MRKSRAVFLDSVQEKVWRESSTYSVMFNHVNRVVDVDSTLIKKFKTWLMNDTSTVDDHKVDDYESFTSDIYNIKLYFFTETLWYPKQRDYDIDEYAVRNFTQGQVVATCDNMKLDIIKPNSGKISHVANLNAIKKIDDSYFTNANVFDNLQPNTLLPDLDPKKVNLKRHEVKLKKLIKKMICSDHY